MKRIEKMHAFILSIFSKNMFWKCAVLKSNINFFTAWVYLLASIFDASSYTIFTEFIFINLYEVDYSKIFFTFIRSVLIWSSL